MKLPLKKAPVAAMPNWHPNFRNAATLPDLKVVRTSFVVNVVCITLAAAAVLFSVYREYLAFSIRTDIRQSERRIAASEARNASLLAMNREFQEGASRFTEAAKFLETPFTGSALLEELGKSLPDYMDFATIAYEGGNITLRGSIRGASDTATARLTEYVELLPQNAIVGKIFQDVSVTNVLRDPRTQGLTFEILLKQAPPPAARRSGASKP